jgi:hypothetical protein
MVQRERRSVKMTAPVEPEETLALFSLSVCSARSLAAEKRTGAGRLPAGDR